MRAVAELNAAQAPPPQAAAMTHLELAALIWKAASLLLPKVDPRLVYTDEEQGVLAAATAPVLEKYLPADLIGPELALAAAVTIITLPKLKSPPKAETPGGGGPSDVKPSEAAPSA